MDVKRVAERIDADASAGYEITIKLERLQNRLAADREYARTSAVGRDPLIRAARDPILTALDRAATLLSQAEASSQEAATYLDEAVELLRDARNCK